MAMGKPIIFVFECVFLAWIEERQGMDKDKQMIL
jgi:hypothetical protein